MSEKFFEKFEKLSFVEKATVLKDFIEAVAPEKIETVFIENVDTGIPKYPTDPGIIDMISGMMNSLIKENPIRPDTSHVQAITTKFKDLALEAKSNWNDWYENDKDKCLDYAHKLSKICSEVLGIEPPGVIWGGPLLSNGEKGKYFKSLNSVAVAEGPDIKDFTNTVVHETTHGYHDHNFQIVEKNFKETLNDPSKKTEIILYLGTKMRGIPEFKGAHNHYGEERGLYTYNPIELHARAYGEALSEILTKREEFIGKIIDNEKDKEGKSPYK